MARQLPGDIKEFRRKIVARLKDGLKYSLDELLEQDTANPDANELKKLSAIISIRITAKALTAIICAAQAMRMPTSMR